MKWTENRKRRSVITFGLVSLLILLGLDQITKLAAQNYLAGTSGIALIPNVFQLYYLENRGAAFGVLNGKQIFFVAVALVMLFISMYIYFCLPDHKNYHLLRFICLLIGAGSLGNMIDRLIHGYVIDFLYFSLIDFPVFNLADCYVCVGAVLAVISLFTVYKEDEFAFLLQREKTSEKKRDQRKE